LISIGRPRKSLSVICSSFKDVNVKSGAGCPVGSPINLVWLKLESVGLSRFVSDLGVHDAVSDEFDLVDWKENSTNTMLIAMPLKAKMTSSNETR